MKKKRGRTSGAEAVEGVAVALREIRQSMTAPLTIDANRGPSTPERLTRAIQLARTDTETSPNEKIQIFKKFRMEPYVADAYLAIDDDDGGELRRLYIRSELF